MPLPHEGQSRGSVDALLVAAHAYTPLVSKRNRLIAILAAVVVVVLVVGIGLWMAQPTDQAPTAGNSPSAPAATASVPAPASPDPSKSLECTTTTQGFEPVRYTIEGSMTVDEKVLSLGTDEKGNIAAPPPAQKRTASWWNEGPKPGTPGKAILSIHTYHNGGALGNELFDGGKSQLKDGDIIKLYGGQGEVACYKYTEAKRIMVSDYDENSDVMIDFEGDPELAMIICWDYDKNVDKKKADPWKSRVFFYGTLF